MGGPHSSVVRKSKHHDSTLFPYAGMDYYTRGPYAKDDLTDYGEARYVDEGRFWRFIQSFHRCDLYLRGATPESLFVAPKSQALHSPPITTSRQRIASTTIKVKVRWTCNR